MCKWQKSRERRYYSTFNDAFNCLDLAPETWNQRHVNTSVNLIKAWHNVCIQSIQTLWLVNFHFDTSLSGSLKLFQLVAKILYFSKTVGKYFNISHKMYLTCVGFPCFIDLLLCRLTLHIQFVSYSLRMLVLMIKLKPGIIRHDFKQSKVISSVVFPCLLSFCPYTLFLILRECGLPHEHV